MKIPRTKRHHKVKSVNEEGHNHLELKKRKKQNNAPKNIDTQEIPKKMQDLFENINKSKEGKVVKKKKKPKGIILKVDKLGVGDKGRKPVTELPDYVIKKPEETKHHFFQRINDLAYKAMLDAEYEKKKPIEIEPDKNSSKKKKLRKLQEKKIAKQREKRAQKEEEARFNFKHLKDEVKFGEVVHGPPVLSKPKLVEKRTQVELNDMEQQRLTVVQLYRKLKAAKQARLLEGKDEEKASWSYE